MLRKSPCIAFLCIILLLLSPLSTIADSPAVYRWDPNDNQQGRDVRLGSDDEVATMLFKVREYRDGSLIGDAVKAYCLDLDTVIRANRNYRVDFLEAVDYFSDDDAAKIRAIVYNSYPSVSLADFRNDSGIGSISVQEVIAATQLAIWRFANSAEPDYSFYEGASVGTASWRVYEGYKYLIGLDSVSAPAHATIHMSSINLSWDSILQKYIVSFSYNTGGIKNFDNTPISLTLEYDFPAIEQITEVGDDKQVELSVDPDDVNAETEYTITVSGFHGFSDAYVFTPVEGRGSNQTLVSIGEEDKYIKGELKCEFPALGSLTVYKELFGDTSALDELPDFNITVAGPGDFSETQTIADGEHYTWNDLYPGIYTVSEDTSGFSEEWAVEIEVESGVVADGDENEVEVSLDSESIVRVKNTFTEEDPVGSLTVHKDVLGDVSGLDELPDFNITVTGPGDFSDTKTIEDGAHYTWTDLAPGIYTVTEDTTGFSTEWSVEIDVESGAVADGEENEVEVIADTESVVRVENTYTEEDPVGSLKVTKQVIDAPDGMTLPLFEIIVTGPGEFYETKTLADGESYTWENLVPGTYFVSEDITDLDGWIVEIDVVVGGVDEGEEGEVAVIADGLSEVVVKNTYDEIEEEAFGSLTVYKEVLGDVSGLSELPDFEITVTGPEGFSDTQIIAGGSSYTWLDLVPGIYTVTEDTSGFSDEWSVEIVVEFGEFIGSEEGEVEVYEDLESEVVVKNTYDEIDEEALGSLTVHKVVTGDTDELDELPEFRFTVTGPNGFSDTKVIAGGESYTWFELEAGTYTVTEDKSELGEGWSVSGEGSVEVVDDLESEITVTNSYNDLPDTGGDPMTMALAGMMLAGVGTVIRRKRR